LDADLAGISAKLEETLNTMQAEVTQLGNKARQTLRTADGAINRADDLLKKPELERALARLDSLSSNADQAILDFRKLVNRSNQTVVKVQNAVHGRGRDIAAITDGLRELVDNLNSLTGMLERHPSLFVFGTPPKPAAKSPAASNASNASNPSVPTKLQK
jgi:ABC-type transporter Mla subunit MlaD